MEMQSSNGCASLGLTTPLFELGFTSIDLIRLKRRIDSRLGISVPVIVLVFVSLAQQLASDERPVFALRARGFEPGQTCFNSVAEMVSVYVSSIRSRQPKGPYALGGYSYGAMVAFELAKELQSRGETVQFLAAFNLPPYIAWRMRHLTWIPCFFHLCMFLRLVNEDWVEERLKDVQSIRSRTEAKALVRQVQDSDRWDELGLDGTALETWADISYGLQRLAVDYEPSGMVKTMDIFHAVPLKAAASSRKEWLENHLWKWNEFCSTRPRFYEVGGEHYTMLDPDHVVAFAETLRIAMRARGL